MEMRLTERIIPFAAMTIYQPTDQEGWQGRLFVRTKGAGPCSLAPAITRTVHRIPAEHRWRKPARWMIFALR